MMKYYFDECTNEVRLYECTSCYYCTNTNGEGLFYVDIERNERTQIIGTCDFSTHGLTKNSIRRKLRNAIDK